MHKIRMEEIFFHLLNTYIKNPFSKAMCVRPRRLVKSGFASLTLLTFTFTSVFVIPFDAITPSAEAAIAPLTPLPSVSELNLPEALGMIQERFEGTQAGQLIVHIQDAHASYDAQRNIQRIIDHLERTYGLGVVTFEGVEGALDPLIFRAFPDRAEMDELLTEYARRGELSGVDLAAVVNHYESRYAGIEEQAIYDAGMAAFLDAERARPAVMHELAKLEDTLAAVQRKTYSPKLKEITEQLRDYEHERLSLDRLLGYLSTLSAPPAGSQIEKLFSAGKKSEEAAAELTHTIDGSKLLDEIRSWSHEIKETIFQNESERDLDRAETALYVLKDLAALQITPQNLETYFSDKDAYTPKRFEALLREMGESAAISFDVTAAVLFYRNALVRDEVLSQRLLALVSEKKYKVAAFVSGGFHTPGFTARLRTEGISFVNVTPAMKDFGGEARYRDVMKGNISYRNRLEMNPRGEADLYKAFSRDVTERMARRLAAEGNVGAALKKWRDEIVRTLVREGRAHEAHRYVYFIDEWAERERVKHAAGRDVSNDPAGEIEKLLWGFSESYLKKYRTKITAQFDALVGEMKKLHEGGALTADRFSSMLGAKTSGIIAAAGHPLASVGLRPLQGAHDSLGQFRARVVTPEIVQPTIPRETAPVPVSGFGANGDIAEISADFSRIVDDLIQWRKIARANDYLKEHPGEELKGREGLERRATNARRQDAFENLDEAKKIFQKDQPSVRHLRDGLEHLELAIESLRWEGLRAIGRTQEELVPFSWTYELDMLKRHYDEVRMTGPDDDVSEKLTLITSVSTSSRKLPRIFRWSGKSDFRKFWRSRERWLVPRFITQLAHHLEGLNDISTRLKIILESSQGANAPNDFQLGKRLGAGILRFTHDLDLFQLDLERWSDVAWRNGVNARLLEEVFANFRAAKTLAVKQEFYEAGTKLDTEWQKIKTALDKYQNKLSLFEIALVPVDKRPDGGRYGRYGFTDLPVTPKWEIGEDGKVKETIYVGKSFLVEDFNKLEPAFQKLIDQLNALIDLKNALEQKATKSIVYEKNRPVGFGAVRRRERFNFTKMLLTASLTVNAAALTGVVAQAMLPENVRPVEVETELVPAVEPEPTETSAPSLEAEPTPVVEEAPAVAAPMPDASARLEAVGQFVLDTSLGVLDWFTDAVNEFIASGFVGAGGEAALRAAERIGHGRPGLIPGTTETAERLQRYYELADEIIEDAYLHLDSSFFTKLFGTTYEQMTPARRRAFAELLMWTEVHESDLLRATRVAGGLSNAVSQGMLMPMTLEDLWKKFNEPIRRLSRLPASFRKPQGKDAWEAALKDDDRFRLAMVTMAYYYGLLIRTGKENIAGVSFDERFPASPTLRANWWGVYYHTSAGKKELNLFQSRMKMFGPDAERAYERHLIAARVAGFGASDQTQLEEALAAAKLVQANGNGQAFVEAKALIRTFPHFYIRGALIVNTKLNAGVVFYGDEPIGKSAIATLMAGYEIHRGKLQKVRETDWDVMAQSSLDGYLVGNQLIVGSTPHGLSGKIERRSPHSLAPVYADETIKPGFVPVSIFVHVKRPLKEDEKTPPISIHESRNIALGGSFKRLKNGDGRALSPDHIEALLKRQVYMDIEVAGEKLVEDFAPTADALRLLLEGKIREQKIKDAAPEKEEAGFGTMSLKTVPWIVTGLLAAGTLWLGISSGFFIQTALLLMPLIGGIVLYQLLVNRWDWFGDKQYRFTPAGDQGDRVDVWSGEREQLNSEALRFEEAVRFVYEHANKRPGIRIYLPDGDWPEHRSPKNLSLDEGFHAAAEVPLGAIHYRSSSQHLRKSISVSAYAFVLGIFFYAFSASHLYPYAQFRYDLAMYSRGSTVLFERTFDRLGRLLGQPSKFGEMNYAQIKIFLDLWNHPDPVIRARALNDFKYKFQIPITQEMLPTLMSLLNDDRLVHSPPPSSLEDVLLDRSPYGKVEIMGLNTLSIKNLSLRVQDYAASLMYQMSASEQIKILEEQLPKWNKPKDAVVHAVGLHILRSSLMDPPSDIIRAGIERQIAIFRESMEDPAFASDLTPAAALEFVLRMIAGRHMDLVMPLAEDVLSGRIGTAPMRLSMLAALVEYVSDRKGYREPSLDLYDRIFTLAAGAFQSETDPEMKLHLVNVIQGQFASFHAGERGIMYEVFEKIKGDAAQQAFFDLAEQQNKWLIQENATRNDFTPDERTALEKYRAVGSAEAPMAAHHYLFDLAVALVAASETPRAPYAYASPFDRARVAARDILESRHGILGNAITTVQRLQDKNPSDWREIINSLTEEEKSKAEIAALEFYGHMDGRAYGQIQEKRRIELIEAVRTALRARGEDANDKNVVEARLELLLVREGLYEPDNGITKQWNDAVDRALESASSSRGFGALSAQELEKLKQAIAKPKEKVGAPLIPKGRSTWERVGSVVARVDYYPERDAALKRVREEKITELIPFLLAELTRVFDRYLSPNPDDQTVSTYFYTKDLLETLVTFDDPRLILPLFDYLVHREADLRSAVQPFFEPARLARFDAASLGAFLIRAEFMTAWHTNYESKDYHFSPLTMLLYNYNIEKFGTRLSRGQEFRVASDRARIILVLPGPEHQYPGIDLFKEDSIVLVIEKEGGRIRILGPETPVFEDTVLDLEIDSERLSRLRGYVSPFAFENKDTGQHIRIQRKHTLTLSYDANQPVKNKIIVSKGVPKDAYADGRALSVGVDRRGIGTLPTLSHRHLELEIMPEGHLVIRDTSKNGTYVIEDAPPAGFGAHSRLPHDHISDVVTRAFFRYRGVVESKQGTSAELSLEEHPRHTFTFDFGEKVVAYQKRVEFENIMRLTHGDVNWIIGFLPQKNKPVTGAPDLKIGKKAYRVNRRSNTEDGLRLVDLKSNKTFNLSGRAVVTEGAIQYRTTLRELAEALKENQPGFLPFVEALLSESPKAGQDVIMPSPGQGFGAAKVVRSPDMRKPGAVKKRREPLLLPDDTPWRSQAVTNAGQIKVGNAVHYVFMGIDQKGIGRFGHAVSWDGYAINEVGDEPIFEAEAGNRDERGGVENPRLTVFDDRIYMLYTARRSFSKFSLRMASIGMEDFLQKNWSAWERHGAVFPGVNGRNGAMFPRQIHWKRRGPKYVMLYRRMPELRLAIADSPEGPWEDAGVQLDIQPPEDSLWIGVDDPPVETVYGWQVGYHYVSRKDHQYRQSFVITDINRPGEIIYTHPNTTWELGTTEEEVRATQELGRFFPPQRVIQKYFPTALALSGITIPDLARRWNVYSGDPGMLHSAGSVRVYDREVLGPGDALLRSGGPFGLYLSAARETIPILQAKDFVDGEERGEDSINMLASLKFLVIDDRREWRDSIRKALMEIGRVPQENIIVPESPEEVETVIQWMEELGYRPDVVILDHEIGTPDAEWKWKIPDHEIVPPGIQISEDGVVHREPGNLEKAKVPPHQYGYSLIPLIPGLGYHSALRSTALIYYTNRRALPESAVDMLAGSPWVRKGKEGEEDAVDPETLVRWHIPALIRERTWIPKETQPVSPEFIVAEARRRLGTSVPSNRLLVGGTKLPLQEIRRMAYNKLVLVYAEEGEDGASIMMSEDGREVQKIPPPRDQPEVPDARPDQSAWSEEPMEVLFKVWSSTVSKKEKAGILGEPSLRVRIEGLEQTKSEIIKNQEGLRLVDEWNLKLFATRYVWNLEQSSPLLAFARVGRPHVSVKTSKPDYLYATVRRGEINITLALERDPENSDGVHIKTLTFAGLPEKDGNELAAQFLLKHLFPWLIRQGFSYVIDPFVPREVFPERYEILEEAGFRDGTPPLFKGFKHALYFDLHRSVYMKEPEGAGFGAEGKKAKPPVRFMARPIHESAPPVRASALKAVREPDALIVPDEQQSVIDGKPVRWRSKRTAAADVVTVDGKIHIVYTAVGEDDISRLGLAISSDGYAIIENKPDPISLPASQAGEGVDALSRILESRIPDENGDIENAGIFPRPINGKHYMVRRMGLNVHLATAPSPAGPWEDAGILIEPRSSDTHLDNGRLGVAGEPIETEYGWLVIYRGIDVKSREYHHYFVILDRDDPSKILYRSDKSILSMTDQDRELLKQAGYADMPDVPDRVFSTGHVRRDGDEPLKHGEAIILYYGISEMITAASTWHLPYLPELTPSAKDSIFSGAPGRPAKKILVVEDDDGIRENVVNALLARGVLRENIMAPGNGPDKAEELSKIITNLRKLPPRFQRAFFLNFYGGDANTPWKALFPFDVVITDFDLFNADINAREGQVPYPGDTPFQAEARKMRLSGGRLLDEIGVRAWTDPVTALYSGRYALKEKSQRSLAAGLWIRKQDMRPPEMVEALSHVIVDRERIPTTPRIVPSVYELERHAWRWFDIVHARVLSRQPIQNFSEIRYIDDREIVLVYSHIPAWEENAKGHFVFVDRLYFDYKINMVAGKTPGQWLPATGDDAEFYEIVFGPRSRSLYKVESPYFMPNLDINTLWEDWEIEQRFAMALNIDAFSEEVVRVYSASASISEEITGRFYESGSFVQSSPTELDVFLKVARSKRHDEKDMNGVALSFKLKVHPDYLYTVHIVSKDIFGPDLDKKLNADLWAYFQDNHLFPFLARLGFRYVTVRGSETRYDLHHKAMLDSESFLWKPVDQTDRTEGAGFGARKKDPARRARIISLKQTREALNRIAWFRQNLETSKASVAALNRRLQRRYRHPWGHVVWSLDFSKADGHPEAVREILHTFPNAVFKWVDHNRRNKSDVNMLDLEVVERTLNSDSPVDRQTVILNAEALNPLSSYETWLAGVPFNLSFMGAFLSFVGLLSVSGGQNAGYFGLRAAYVGILGLIFGLIYKSRTEKTISLAEAVAYVRKVNEAEAENIEPAPLPEIFPRLVKSDEGDESNANTAGFGVADHTEIVRFLNLDAPRIQSLGEDLTNRGFGFVETGLRENLTTALSSREARLRGPDGIPALADRLAHDELLRGPEPLSIELGRLGISVEGEPAGFSLLVNRITFAAEQSQTAAFTSQHVMNAGTREEIESRIRQMQTADPVVFEQALRETTGALGAALASHARTTTGSLSSSLSVGYEQDALPATVDGFTQFMERMFGRGVAASSGKLHYYYTGERGVLAEFSRRRENSGVSSYLNIIKPHRMPGALTSAELTRDLGGAGVLVVSKPEILKGGSVAHYAAGRVILYPNRAFDESNATLRHLSEKVDEVARLVGQGSSIEIESLLKQIADYGFSYRSGERGGFIFVDRLAFLASLERNFLAARQVASAA